MATALGRSRCGEAIETVNRDSSGRDSQPGRASSECARVGLPGRRTASAPFGREPGGHGLAGRELTPVRYHVPMGELIGTDRSASEVGARRIGGPTPRLSADLIADAVIEIGFDRASMSSVGRHLECSHGALYRHVGDLDSMLHLAVTRAIVRFEWPVLVDEWREVVWNEVRAWWSFCEQHPGFVTVLASGPGMPSPMSQRSVAVAVHLNRLGVSGDDALLIIDIVMDMVHDTFHRSGQRRAVIDRALTMSAAELDAHVASVPDDMLETMASTLIDDPWPWLERKLQLLMNGVETITPGE